MFAKFAADALGIADIGSIISPDNYNKTDSDDYVMHEEGEKIFFLIKSKTDEYCFTDRALIHLDGTSAMSKKRMLYRLPYYKYQIHEVQLETAGTIDMDVEIKFYLGDKHYSIDVHKNQIEQLKDLYKTLLKISEIQSENQVYLAMGEQALEQGIAAIGRVNKADVQIDAQVKGVTEYAWGWLSENRGKFVKKNFADVFEKFINS